VDEYQKDHEIVDFLQTKQKPSEPVYFLSKYLRKTFMDWLLPNIRGKLQEKARPRNFQEAKRKKSSVLINIFFRVMEKQV